MKRNASFASVNRAYDFYVRCRQRGRTLTQAEVNLGQERRRRHGHPHFDQIGKHTYDCFARAWELGFRCRQWPGINNLEYRVDEDNPNKHYRDTDRGYDYDD